MSVPFTAEEMYQILLPSQKARLFIGTLERQGRRPSVSALANVAGVSRATARRQLRRTRRKKGGQVSPPKAP